MKKSVKTVLCTGVAAAFLFTSGYFGFDYSKKWVNQKIQSAISQYEQQDKQQIKQEFNNYEEKDKQWTNETLNQYGKNDKESTEQTVKKGINDYETKDKQWTNQTFETKLPLEEIAKTSNSAYMIIHWATFETITGELIETPIGTGSGVLLSGGYFLTAQHVTNIEIPQTIVHPIYGPLKYHHSEFSLTNERASQETEKQDCIEKIITGSKEGLDYTLLKLKEDSNLAFYANGLNIPSKIEPGMKTIAIGYPLALGKNIRLGAVTQINSDLGEHYMTYDNNVLPSDSGGALFIIENNELKLTALSTVVATIQGQQISNINYGVKVSSILKDMEEQLSSGKLDQKTTAEVQNFLKINKK